jgi:hypothetical protein
MQSTELVGCLRCQLFHMKFPRIMNVGILHMAWSLGMTVLLPVLLANPWVLNAQTGEAGDGR